MDGVQLTVFDASRHGGFSRIPHASVQRVESGTLFLEMTKSVGYRQETLQLLLVPILSVDASAEGIALR